MSYDLLYVRLPTAQSRGLKLYVPSTAQLGLLIVAFALAWLFYIAAIGRAAAWGETVKSAFDLYRHKLLEQLGYAERPASLDEERSIWRRLSQQIIFGDTRRISVPSFSVPRSEARATPRWLRLALYRGVGPPGTDCVQAVTLHVRNSDPSTRDASHVRLFETLPAGVEYVHGSAMVIGGGALRITGVNPIVFDIGNLSAGDEKQLTFKVIRYQH